MMDSHFQSFHRDAQDMRAKFHDARDLPNHPTTQHISNEFDHLVAQSHEGNARRLHDTAKGIQRRIWQAHNQGQNIISPEHTNYFHDRLEHFSTNVRKHPHFN